MPIRLLIGYLSFVILIVTPVCNMLEGTNQIVDQNAFGSNVLQHSYTTSTSTSGTDANFLSMSLEWIDKYIFMDYSVFFDIDPVTGERTDNMFAILRYALIVIGIALLINLFFYARASSVSV